MRQENRTTMTAGIYMIICLLLGIAYVGGSARLFKRLDEHLDHLRLNRHKNKQLQEDWNTLGADCFALFPLEILKDASQLRSRERAWTRKSLIEGKVYNRLNAVTERHKEAFVKHRPKWPKETDNKSAKNYTFISPTGTEFKVKGYNGICSAYGLNASHLSKVVRGIYVHHRGWTAKLKEEV